MVRDALVVAKYLGAKGAAGGLGVCPSAATSPASSSVARIKRAAAFTAPLERSPTGANARHRAAALREPRAACAISPLLGRQRRPAARACVVDAERSQPRLRAADSARPWDPRRAYNASGSVCQGGARAAHVPNARATREQRGAQQQGVQQRGLRGCAAFPARKCTHARSHTALERAAVCEYRAKGPPRARCVRKPKGAPEAVSSHSLPADCVAKTARCYDVCDCARGGSASRASVFNRACRSCVRHSPAVAWPRAPNRRGAAGAGWRVRQVSRRAGG